MKRKGSALVAVLIVVIVLVSAGGIWYYESRQPFQPVISPNGGVINPDSLNVDTSNWMVCKNDQYGYEIKYPPGWMTWELGQNWYQDPQVTCEGQQDLVFAPVDPGLERVSISVWPEASNGDLEFSASGPLPRPDSTSSAPWLAWEVNTIDGEKAIWNLATPKDFPSREDSVTILHNHKFYIIDYSLNKSTSSMDQTELDFQALVESFKFL